MMSTMVTDMERIQQLREQLREANQLYYAGSPIMTDAEFDQLLTELRELEGPLDEIDPLSPTQLVGAPISEFQQHEHVVPMLSIDNCFELAEIDTFIQGLLLQHGGDLTFAVDWKIDGCAISLSYESGRLIRALTRGDSRNGEDITHNAKTFLGLPLVLPSRHSGITEIRGEAFISHADFETVKAAHLEATGETLANSRNACAGALRAKNPADCRARMVRFMVHGFGQVPDNFLTHEQIMQSLPRLGFSVVPHSDQRVEPSNVRACIESLVEAAGTLQFPVDGIVVKVNDRATRELIGAGSKYVNWARAYKWERYEAETTVNGITVQVGKQGTLTPVAELEPVEVAETTVSRASLFNQDELDRLEISVGCRVVVEKAGKIIPHIVRVIPSDDDPPWGRATFQIPDDCPSCNQQVIRLEGEVAKRCTNPDCPAVLEATLLTFASRSRMDIEGMGSRAVQQLLQHNLVTCIPDLYRLHVDPEAMLVMDKVGPKKRDKLLAAIEASKEREAWRLLAGLNIPHIGTTVSQQLLERYGSIPAIFELTREQLMSNAGIGETIADALGNFMDSGAGQRLIAALAQAGCRLENPVSGNRILEGPLAGLTIVPTGDLEHFTRDQIKLRIREMGGKPTSSVSRKTDYVLAGRTPGAKKIQKAEELGIEVISEEQFLEMISVE